VHVAHPASQQLFDRTLKYMDNARGEIVRQEAEAVNNVCMNILTSRIRQPLTHKRFYHGFHVKFFSPAPLCKHGTSGPVSVCLSLSVTRRCSVETSERIELLLAWRLSSTCPTLCYDEIQLSKSYDTSLWNFVLNSVLNFAKARRSS